MWSSVYRYGAASLLVALAPYLLPGVIGELGFTVLVFPVTAALLSFFAAYLIAVQYRLYKQVDREFRRQLGEFAPPELGQGRVRDRLLTVSLGRTLTFAFLFFSIPLQIASAVLLARLVRRVTASAGTHGPTPLVGDAIVRLLGVEAFAPEAVVEAARAAGGALRRRRAGRWPSRGFPPSARPCCSRASSGPGTSRSLGRGASTTGSGR